jgi:hypothetical protein
MSEWLAAQHAEMRSRPAQTRKTRILVQEKTEEGSEEN